MKKDFKNLVSTFKNSIKTWDYFVNWKKVFLNSSELEITLNKLNYLLGKQNLKEEFLKLYSSNPDIVKALPVLLAIREKNIEFFDPETKKSIFFNFNKKEDKNANEYYEFIEKTGLIKLFKEDGIKNLVDSWRTKIIQESGLLITEAKLDTFDREPKYFMGKFT